MVVICLPSAALTGSEQERTGSPSRWTVQAPHCAMPQPYLVPVRPTFSRIAHSSGVSGSTSTWKVLPLIVRFAIAFPWLLHPSIELQMDGLESGSLQIKIPRLAQTADVSTPDITGRDVANPISPICRRHDRRQPDTKSICATDQNDFCAAGIVAGPPARAIRRCSPA